MLLFCAVGISPPKEVQVGDLIKVGTDICIQRNRPTRFDLLCVIQDVDLTEGIRISLPTPTRTWSTDPQNTVIFESSINVDPTFNPDFFEDGFRQILLPGLVGHPLSIGTQGSLLFSLGFEQNLTNPNILPDLPRRDSEYIRDLVFDEILGTYTCLVENEYGCDTATTTISECGKHNSLLYI